MREAAVQGDELGAVLHRACRDPQLVGWDGLPLRAERRVDDGVPLSGGLANRNESDPWTVSEEVELVSVSS